MQDRKLYSIKEARELLGGISRNGIYALLRTGELASVVIGCRRFISGAEIAALINQSTTTVATAFGLFIFAPLGTRVVFALVIAASVFFGGVAATKWGIYQRFRYRADFGATATVTMSEAGLDASGPHVQGKWDWAAYPSAVRYPDGIMLLRRGVIRWLPDSALLVGTPEEATALARSRSALRELT
jgi:hypothetical protein